MANGLMRAGVRKGDRVGALLNNGREYAEMYFAVPKCGGIIVPLNYRLSPRELCWIVNHAEVKVLVVDEGYLGLLRPVRAELTSVQQVITVGGRASQTTDYEEVIASSSPEEPEIDAHEDEVVGIFYTSGTTGVPKGAMLTHRNLMSTCQAICIETKIGPSDKFLIVSPMYHTVTPSFMFAHMYRSSTVVAIDHFDPDLLLSTIQNEHITHVFLVPSMIIFAMEHPNFKDYDLSSLRLVWYGGSPMAGEKVAQAMDLFKCDFGQGFGMTEIGPCFVSVLSPEEHRELLRKGDYGRLSSAGRNYSNAEVRIVDEEDRELPIGMVGEICVRGPHVMKGYWKMPEETEEALRGGWFHTGDVGRIDDQGYLFVVDRKKDMIISGGENIYSAEVENVISSHPAVREVAVIGVPDPQWGEAVKAIVALKPGMTATEDEIIEHCKKNLASYKKPKSVEFVDALPRNVMGKVLKKELREKYWKGYDRRVH
jgi:long-chain acyl-CoA synthetase